MKKLLALALALCMICSLCACGSSAPAASAPAASQSGAAAPAKDSVVLSMAQDNTTFDPMGSMSVGFMVNSQIFETLVREETSGELSEGLAESWEVSDDNLSITFKIREGVKFHNGDVLTVDDVVFSLNRAIAGSNIDAAAYMDTATAVDDTHVCLTLKSAYSDIFNALALTNMAIVNKKDIETNGEDFTHPIGTGPYEFVSWTPGVSIEFKAFPEYWRGEAAIKNATMIIQVDPSTGAIALENGEIDILGNVMPIDVDHLKTLPNVNVLEREAVSTYTVYLSCTDGPLADARVRKAFALCVNRDEINIGALNGTCAPAASIISPSMAYYNPSFAVPQQNIEEAKALLKEAGYADGFTVKFATVAEAPDLVAIGMILQGQLALAGINLEMDVLELATWFQNVQMNHEFDVTAAATTASSATTNAVLSNILMPNGINNLGLYSNDRVTELLSAAIASYDTEENQKMYDEVISIILEEYPVIGLATSVQRFAANKDLKGVEVPAVMTFYFYDWSWAE